MVSEGAPDPRFNIGDQVMLLIGQWAGEIASITYRYYGDRSLEWMYDVAITPDGNPYNPYYEHEIKEVRGTGQSMPGKDQQ
jgi:hypothetical protein